MNLSSLVWNNTKIKKMNNFFLLILILLLQSAYGQNKITETQKLVATCKVWGFLKYYHPEVACGKFNWDEQLFKILPKIENSKNEIEFSLVIERWIEDLGEIKKIAPIKVSDTIAYFSKNQDLSWLNKNLLFSKNLRKKLLFIKDNRWQGKQFYVYTNIDQIDYSTDGIQLQNEVRYSDFKWDNKNLRILILFRFWNIIEYFYPNKYLMEQSWGKSLNEILLKFIICETEKSFHDSINEIVVDLNDSHAVYFPDYKGFSIGKFFLPADFKFIDNKMIITKILNDSIAKANDLKMGDEITIIDKKLISNIVSENRKNISGSNNSAYLRNLATTIRRFKNNKIEVEFVRDSIKNKIISLYSANDFFHDYDKKPEHDYEIFENNIGYVNMGCNLKKIMPEMLSKLRLTKAIIFDLRNYPKNESVNELGVFINNVPKAFAKSTNPDLSYPGRFYWSKPFILESSTEPFGGNVIVLVNEKTQSWSETIAMYFKTSKKTVIIGSQTAGADGAVTRIEAMKDVYINFTGAGFYYPDGKEVQRKGIVPDILCKQTIVGIREGKDELLERALNFIKTGK